MMGLEPTKSLDFGTKTVELRVTKTVEPAKSLDCGISLEIYGIPGVQCPRLVPLSQLGITLKQNQIDKNG